MTGLENMRKTKLLPRKRRMIPTSGKLLVDNIAGIPNEGVVRVMPENKIYSYSGVVPTRKRRMKEHKKCYSYISYDKINLSNHNFIREVKDGDGICSVCGIVVDGQVLDNLLK